MNNNERILTLCFLTIGFFLGLAMPDTQPSVADDDLYTEVWAGVGQTNLHLMEQGYYGGTYFIPSQQWVMICRDLPICLNELGQVVYNEREVAGPEWEAVVTAYVKANPDEFNGIIDFSEAGLQEYYAFMFKRSMLGEHFDGVADDWFALHD